MEQTYIINHAVKISCIEGVAVELRHVLPKGWKMTEESGSFVVHGEQREDWEDDLWRIVRFVAYPFFLSFSRTHKSVDESRYELVSSNPSGRGFRVEFILANLG